MNDDDKMGETLDSFVDSLKEEQKTNILIEDSLKKQNGSKELDSDIKGLEKIKVILKKSLELICLGEKIKVSTDSKEFKLLVDGGDLGVAIGKEGKNIQALEYIINLIGKRKNIVERTVFIDIKNYRKNKIEDIKKEAIKMARKAIKEGRKISLNPMCAYERKIIHRALSKFDNIRTKSADEEPRRRIIIYPEKASK